MSTFNRIESAWCIYRNARKWGYFLTQREQLPSAVQHGCGPMPTNLFWLSLSRSLALLSTFLSTKPCQTLIITSPSLSAAISTNIEQERDTHEQRCPLGSGFGRGDEAVLSNKQGLQLWTSCSVQELRHTHAAWSASGRRRNRLCLKHSLTLLGLFAGLFLLLIVRIRVLNEHLKVNIKLWHTTYGHEWMIPQIAWLVLEEVCCCFLSVQFSLGGR